MTDRQFIQFLRRKQGDRSATDFAAEIGICRSYLHHIYSEVKPAGPTVLKYFGMKRATAHIVRIK